MLTRKEIQSRYRKKNPVTVAKAKAAWAAKNPSYYKDKAAEHRITRKARIKAIRIKSRYGQEPPYPAPDNCEGCKRPFVETSKHHGACFDHDHVTGKFRGWLCNDCNLVLGYAKDSRDRLQLLINYLDKVELLS